MVINAEKIVDILQSMVTIIEHQQAINANMQEEITHLREAVRGLTKEVYGS